MTYATGPISATANPGPVLYAAIETALLSAGFTLVDTVTISTRTHKIFKSPAGSNLYAKDWYLDVTYNLTGTSDGITFRTFEHFDPATDLAYRGPGLSNSVVSYTPDLTTWSWAGSNGYALETNWNLTGPRLSTSTSNFTYWFSATVDRVILMLSTSTTNVVYAGFYEPDPYFHAQAGAASCPLFCGSFSAASGFGYLTRLPMVADGSWPWSDYNLDVNIYHHLNARYMSSWSPTTPVASQWSFYTAFRMNLMKMGQSGYGGTVLGTLIDVRYNRGNTSSSQVQGDTAWVTTNPAMPASGDEYVLAQRSTHLLLFRMA